MALSQDILLPILLLTIVANIAIVAVLLATGRLGRKGMFAAGHAVDPFDGAILSTSYVDPSSDGAWASSSMESDPDPAVEPAPELTATEPAPESEAPPTPESVAAEPAVELEPERIADEPAPESEVASASEFVATEPEPDPAAGEAAITEPNLDLIPAVADADGQASSPPAGTGVDPLTGLPDAAAFHRLVAVENARMARYHHPTTVVIVELEGLDRLIERLGPEAGERIIPPVADTLRRLARSADHVARLGPGQFGVLLPETDEILAINYIERVRRACELWLESGAIALQLAIGWAGTGGDPTLTDVQRIAVERMHVESRRAARRAGVDDGPGRIGS
jgi:diguanylate cyclase (GGDEF)-like protein